jgi:hypothetical protein
MPNRENATYCKRGIYLARRIISKRYPDYKLECHNGYYVINPPTGEVLSPLCTGEGPALRFAALLSILIRYSERCPNLTIDLLDDTMVDELTGKVYEDE